MGFGFHMPARRLKCGFYVQPVHWRDDPAHDESWADRMAAKYGGRKSPGWLREYEMQPQAAGLPVWGMLSREVHLVAHSWAEIIGPAWTRYRVLDHGVRHPTCCGWVAVNSRGDQYWYRQYYATDRTIAENAHAIRSLESRDESVRRCGVADPALWQRSPESLKTYADLYSESGLNWIAADNSAVGYELVASGFIAALARWSLERGEVHPRLAPRLDRAVLEELAAHQAIWFHPSLAAPQSLFGECENLRWKEIHGDPYQVAAPQKPVDVNDEGADVVRYARATPFVRWCRPAPSSEADVISALVAEGGKRRG